MSCDINQTNTDFLLKDMKASKKRPAVLKTDLANIKSNCPQSLIFAFEGKHDKGVYYQWIRCVRQDLRYEPFPCNGKAQVLKLKEMIERDLDSIGNGVYFFIDRDFDDLRGHSPDLSMYDRSILNRKLSCNRFCFR